MKFLWIGLGTVFLLALIVWIRTMVTMPYQSYRGVLPPLSSEEKLLEGRLKHHVQVLAGEIGERNLWRYAALEAAAGYIGERFEEAGYGVVSQDFEVEGREVRNLGVQIEGFDRKGEILLVGAHYDSVAGCPGANDNASGVAGLIEMSRLLAGRRMARTVRLVAFVNEEPPFFQTGRMGSLVYARAARARKENIVGALSLETIGYYSDEPGSQHYPQPFGLAYPNRGDFIGFVGNRASEDLVRRSIASFRRHTKFPSEGIAAPGSIEGIGWSDHWSFWQEGYSGIMITDTAPFRYPHYHEGTDLPEYLDYSRLARVVAGLCRVVAELAGEEKEGDITPP